MKGKFIKKLMAYALTAAMVVSTPMTAFASEFADNFWVSDGVDDHDEADHGPNPTGTGTVSSTNTNTTVLDQLTNVKGITIKEKNENNELTPTASTVINLSDIPTTKTLVAEVQYEDGADITDEQKKAIEEKITWRSSNLEIVRPAARQGSRATCPINAYKGGFASITASIDVDNDGEADYMARVMVMVKKTVTAVHLNIPDNKLYAGHTYDLMDYVSFGSPQEFDVVTFTYKFDGDEKKQKLANKLVARSNDGTFKIDKKLKNKDGLKVTITATANGISATADVVLSEGYPVTKMVMDNKKPTYAIDEDYKKVGDEWKLLPNYDPNDPNNKENRKARTLKVTATTKSGKPTTDDITWSSSDNRIVRIIPQEDDKGVRFEGLAVGKATITATATSGKTAKVNVTVTAKLLQIKSATIKNNKTYSGKTTPIVIERVPKQNTDKLKVVIDKKDEKKVVKAKAGINPVITPANDLVTKLNYDGKEITSVKVEPANKKLGIPAETVKAFTVHQSDVELTDVKGVVFDKASGKNKVTSVDKKTVNMNSNRMVTYFATVKDPTKAPGLDAVSWTSSKETVATVDDGRIKVIGDGSAKITVSSVYKNTKGKFATIKKSFTIKSTPKCEEIILKSNIVTVKEGAKTATINIKQQSPKKANDTVKWYTYDEKTGEMKLQSDPKTATNKKLTIATTGKRAGDVITVIAMAGSAEVEAKIVVVAK